MTEAGIISHAGSAARTVASVCRSTSANHATQEAALLNDYSIALKKNDVVDFIQTDFMKRFYFTIALAATLTGCTCFAPRHAARTGSKTIAKSGKIVAVKKESLRHRTNTDTHTKIAGVPITVKTPPQRDDKSNAESKNLIATKIQTPQPSQSDGKPNAESHMNAIAAKTETSQSSQLDDETVIKKAMVTIAAKMDNPASAVFLEVNRAARKDAFGNSIDTVCGRVRGKLAGDNGDRPFLYVVQKDEAYIGAYALATAEYRSICN